MPVTINTDDAHCALHFSGELSIYTAEEHMTHIRSGMRRDLPVHVDLSAVDEMDAAGLQILVAVKSHAVAHGQSFHLLAQSQAVMELLELSDMAGFFGAAVVISDVPS